MKVVLYILFALIASFPVMGTVLTSVSKANAIPLENITAPIDFAFTGTVLRANRGFITFADETDGTILFHSTTDMMPKKNGVQATLEILEENPEAKILILTTFGTADEVRQVLDAGALGVIVL